MSKNVFKIFSIIVISALLFSCKKDDTGNNNEVSNTDGDFEELNQVLDQIPTENVTINDLKFSDGAGMIEFLKENDPDFFTRNAEFLEDYNQPVESSSLRSSTANNAESSWLLLEQKRIIATLSTAALFYLKDDKGVAENAAIRRIINDRGIPKQSALYYSYGQRIWYKRLKQEHMQSCDTLVFGLDCSGLLYNVLESAGLKVLKSTENKANDYWINIDKWNAALPNSFNKKLQFKQYNQAEWEKLPEQILMGDIVFYFNEKGEAKHVGIIVGKKGTYLLAQSNGTDQDCIETDKSRSWYGRFANGNPNRGPRAINLRDPIYANGWHYKSLGIIRLTAIGVFNVSFSNITTNSALATIDLDPSAISLQASETIQAVGICYSNTNNIPTVGSYPEKHVDYNISHIDFSLLSLLPGTTYYVRGYVKTSANRYIYADETTNFTTLIFDLSPDQMNFKKEGGTGSFTIINTSFSVTDISSNRSWCKVSYNEKDPKVVTITVDKNSTTEPRTATIQVEAVNPVTGEKTSKSVQINQEGEEEEGDGEPETLEGTYFANTKWNVTETGSMTVTIKIPGQPNQTVTNPINTTGVIEFTNDGLIADMPTDVYGVQVSQKVTVIDKGKIIITITTNYLGITISYDYTFTMESANSTKLSGEMKGQYSDQATSMVYDVKCTGTRIN